MQEGGGGSFIANALSVTLVVKGPPGMHTFTQESQYKTEQQLNDNNTVQTTKQQQYQQQQYSTYNKCVSSCQCTRCLPTSVIFYAKKTTTLISLITLGTLSDAPDIIIRGV